MYSRLIGAKIFSTLDLRSGYYHISLFEKSKAKTAFVTPFEAVPFGLGQAPTYFQQLISMVLQDCSSFAMAYLAFPFSVCRKFLSDNGTEFKNELFTQVADQLGVEREIYIPPYRPQSNGCSEGFYNFLKACLSKHISRQREWDNVIPMATASYNWLPNQHSRNHPSL